MGQKNPQHVFVALSGGVDSAVAAALLLEQGYKVTGVFMKNWSGDNFGIQADCPWEEDQKSAEMVAKQLGIEFRSYNFEKEYRAHVVDYFFAEYKAGRTPNPDILCNREIKFGTFLTKALSDGADLIATGHYARVSKDKEGNYHLLRGLDTNKDQSYFLYTLNQGQLSRTLFPIGEYTKLEIRKLAHKFELPNASRPDSQGICFIGEIDVQEFLRANIITKPGDIVDVDTKDVVGKHDGVYYYTIGQREGLGIGGQKVAYFVTNKDAVANVLYVAHGHDHPALNKREVNLENLHLINPDANLKEDAKISASGRYRQASKPGMLDQKGLKFTFTQPQRALAPGQSLVLYSDQECIGGGIIGSVL